MTKPTDTDLRRARAAAQLLGPARTRRSAADVVSWMLAVQAQDIRSVPLALRARARDLTAARITAAREDGSIVRTWGPRGTLHLVARDDLGWLTPLVLRPWHTHAMTRLRQEGITGTPATLVRAVERALAGQGPLTKQRLAARLAEQGQEAHGQGIVYLAFLAGIVGRAVLGPDQANRPTYVHAADWLGSEIMLEPDHDRALAELAVRYLRAHGPAGPEDLAAWTRLPLRDARAAFRLAAARGAGQTPGRAAAEGLVEVEHGGSPLWRLRRPARSPAPPGRLVLLPAFDEYLLGWRDRSLVLPPAYAKRVVPGGGMVKPAVVVDGTVVGTWSQTTRQVEWFETSEPAGDVSLETEDVDRFLTGTRAGSEG